MNAEAVRAWLEARYDEDEQVAKAATWHEDAGTWKAEPSPYGAGSSPGPRWYIEDSMEDGVISDVDPQASDAEGVAQHIALHDPARALREVAAKRRRLERHKPVEVWVGHDHIPPGQPGAREMIWVDCSWCIEYVGDGTEYDCEHTNRHWPCPDIIDDAQAWADRDDIPAELRLP